MPIWLTSTALKYGGIALAALVLVLGIYFKGRHDVQVKFDAYKVEIQAAAEAQAKESAKVDARNAKLFKDAQYAYNTSLTNLRAYYKLRNNGISPMPQVSGTTPGVNDYSPDHLPPTPILAGQCAETTLTLILLQNFIKQAQINAE